MTRTMAQVTKEKVPQTWEVVEPLFEVHMENYGNKDTEEFLEEKYDVIKNDSMVEYDIMATSTRLGRSSVMKFDKAMIGISTTTFLAVMNKDVLEWCLQTQLKLVDKIYKGMTALITRVLPAVQWMAHFVTEIFNNMVYYVYKVDYVIM